MPRYAILAWQPLLRPPLPNEVPPMDSGALDIPLKTLACRNQVASVMALVIGDKPAEAALINVSDLASHTGARIPASAVSVFQVGAVSTPEVGPVCDPLYPVEVIHIERSAALYVRITVPEDTPAGTYLGEIAVVVGGDDVAAGVLELEVANVDLPDVHEWDFFLNVWMNPGAVAHRHRVEMWSDEHFARLRPYVVDLALHGQKTVVAPICHQPWGTQTPHPYPNLVQWIKRGNTFEFDFSVFDRYIELHEDMGIDRAIHCYTLAQCAGDCDRSIIEYMDSASGELRRMETAVGDPGYAQAWGSFLQAFSQHLKHRRWLERTYIGFDEKPDAIMDKVIEFLRHHGPELKISLAGNVREELYASLDDLSLHVQFTERGVGQNSPPERAAMGVAQLLDPDRSCALTRTCPTNATTTFYVCCGPAFPNTFVHSPLVESRMLPWFAAQGGYDGFLRWSYNDWPDDPYSHPEWGNWPTGDAFLVYPGENGPISSLRWEQLREGIQDFQLAMIASANIHTPEEMVDYEQAITLACRNPDGRMKSLGDIEIARRLLIPIAEHLNER